MNIHRKIDEPHFKKLNTIYIGYDFREYDATKILIDSNYPDIRRTINSAQRNVVDLQLKLDDDNIVVKISIPPVRNHQQTIRH